MAMTDKGIDPETLTANIYFKQDSLRVNVKGVDLPTQPFERAGWFAYWTRSGKLTLVRTDEISFIELVPVSN